MLTESLRITRLIRPDLIGKNQKEERDKVQYVMSFSFMLVSRSRLGIYVVDAGDHFGPRPL
jgi:hypothetical protein